MSLADSDCCTACMFNGMPHAVVLAHVVKPCETEYAAPADREPVTLAEILSASCCPCGSYFFWLISIAKEQAKEKEPKLLSSLATN